MNKKESTPNIFVQLIKDALLPVLWMVAFVTAVLVGEGMDIRPLANIAKGWLFLICLVAWLCLPIPAETIFKDKPISKLKMAVAHIGLVLYSVTLLAVGWFVFAFFYFVGIALLYGKRHAYESAQPAQEEKEFAKSAYERLLEEMRRDA